jgi:nucleotide-binding universal stress UspA family protein
VFCPNGIGQALDCLRDRRFFIFKVHGDVNLPGSIVLSNRDYARLLYLSPGYRSFLETLFASYTVLFVGFGGADPDLDGIIDRLSTIYERSIGQHFILISEEEFSALERRRLLEDKRLDCITYKRDASHSQVVEFLRALAQRTGPDAKVEVPFTGDKRQPRVFVSGSYKQIELLRQVAEVVRRAGFDVWFAETQVSPGDRIVDEISKAIDEADCLIAVMSEGAGASSWVNFEVGRAFGAHKPVLPIRVGEAHVPSDLRSVVYLQVKGPRLTTEDGARLAVGLTRLLETTKDS